MKVFCKLQRTLEKVAPYRLPPMRTVHMPFNALSSINADYPDVLSPGSGLEQAGLLTIPVPAATAAAEAASLLYTARKPVIVTLGDSQTMFGSLEGGWVNKLFTAYGFTVDVLNKGMGMGTTRGAKKLTEALVQPLCLQDKLGEQVRLVTIFYGSNDGSPVNRDENKRMVPLEEYQQNLVEMITTLQAAGVKGILLITAPPRGEYKPSVMAPYAEAMIAVGQAYQVPVADFYNAVLSVPDWPTDVLRSDRLHLSQKGNQLLYDTVMQTIQQSLPDIAPKTVRASVSFMEDLPASSWSA